MDNWVYNAIYLATAVGMVLLNAFFVAAEFGLVKVRGGQLDALVAKGGHLPARHAGWAIDWTRPCPPANSVSRWPRWA